MFLKKFGVIPSNGHLVKSAAFSAFALSALAGSVMLSGGEAKATLCNFNNGGLTDCTYNQPYVTNPVPTDKVIKYISGPTSGKGDIEWKWVDVNMNNTWLIPPDPHSVDEWHVDVDFNPDLLPTDNPSTLKYVVAIDKTNPLYQGYYFEDVSLGSIIGPSVPGGLAGEVKKEIYRSLNGVQGSLIGTLTNSGTLNLLSFWPGEKFDELYIIDTATPNTSTIDAYQNIYRQVPGPLPILGAGAAFGFSRKLRNRIKGNSAA